MSTLRESIPQSFETITDRLRRSVGAAALSLTQKLRPDAKEAQPDLPELTTNQAIFEIGDLRNQALANPEVRDELAIRADQLALPIIETLKQRQGKMSRWQTGIAGVLTAAHASDTFQTAATDELLVAAINDFQGEAQTRLAKTYKHAKANNIPFFQAAIELEDGQRLTVKEPN